ncbi:P22_AR N-terminal domain [Moraxella bovis]|uniref:P22_AR N-terminal domain n=1 Tax=Moraxella bovis TaxID=476 RepID=A0A378PXK2_MORBO|nr:P22_AR N-terminal domain [Moraxella bovis]
MTNQIQTVNFHNQSLLTLQKDGIAYVAMKSICENIGLNWDAQRQRINRDEVLA